MPSLRAALLLTGLTLTLGLLLGTVPGAAPLRGAPARGGSGRGVAAEAQHVRIPPTPIDLASDPAWRLTLLRGIGPVRAREIVRARAATMPP